MTEFNMSAVTDKIARAKTALILDHPFFACILLSLPLDVDAGLNPPTMATNGKRILVHPQFVLDSSNEEVQFGLCHETMHVVFKHMFRRGERDPFKYNLACDYVINGGLVADKIGKMPEGCLHDDDLVKRGHGTSEGVYELLPDMPNGGACWDMMGEDGTDGTDAATGLAESDIDVMVAQAAAAAKMQGKMSGTLERLVMGALKPKVDWRNVLRSFVTEKVKLWYSFARPKRRFLGDGLYLPSLTGEGMGEIVVAVDVSGSISDKELSEFIAEVQGIKEDTNPTRVHVVYFHHTIDHHDIFEQDDELFVSKTGSGGTAFSPIFRYVEEQDIPATCCVVLTDLCCNDFGDPPPYPVLWVSNMPGSAPWGQVIDMEKGS